MIGIISINALKLKGNKYILRYLSEIKACCNRVIICVSDMIEDELRSEISAFSTEIYEYKTYVDICRWSDVLLNKLSDIDHSSDDVLLTNDSVLGPFRDLSQIVGEMQSRELDFWGMTAHGRMSLKDLPTTKEYCERFIQTYFLVLSKKILKDERFFAFMEKQKNFKDYYEAALSFEFTFTSLFEDMGYKWDVYVDTKDLESDDPDYYLSFILFNLNELVKTRGLPFIPKVVFDIDNIMMQTFSYGGDLGDTIRYIKDTDAYDVDLIYDHVINNMNLYDMITRLNMNYVLPAGCEGKSRHSSLTDIKTAVFAYVYYEDLFEYCLEKLSHLPVGTDIFVATDTAEKKKILEKMLENRRQISRCRVLLHGGKGRDISSLLITFKPFLMDYEIIGYLHDKKSSQLAYPTIGAAFNNSLWENMVYNREFVSEVIDLFDKNPRLGMLVPPMIMYGTYFNTSVDLWTINYDNTKELAEKIGIDMISDPDKNPVALGSVFWCRTASLKKLFEHGFDFSDFPDEPMAPDGTFSHAVERIFPYVAQDAGFYTGIIMNPESAAIRCNNNNVSLNSILRELKKYPFVNLVTLNDAVMSLKQNAPRKKKQGRHIMWRKK